MNTEHSNIRDRLQEVLESLYCPVSGCWSLHGCRYEYRESEDGESYVLEVWPVGIEEPSTEPTNGHHRSERGLVYEPAEFDFSALGEMQPERFHFSQRDSVFEIIWQENGVLLALRLHIVPFEVDEDT